MQTPLRISASGISFGMEDVNTRASAPYATALTASREAAKKYRF
jgi:hypothetical protein